MDKGTFNRVTQISEAINSLEAINKQIKKGYFIFY